jgi:hypothetical protein
LGQPSRHLRAFWGRVSALAPDFNQSARIDHLPSARYTTACADDVLTCVQRKKVLRHKTKRKGNCNDDFWEANAFAVRSCPVTYFKGIALPCVRAKATHSCAVIGTGREHVPCNGLRLSPAGSHKRRLGTRPNSGPCGPFPRTRHRSPSELGAAHRSGLQRRTSLPVCRALQIKVVLTLCSTTTITSVESGPTCRQTLAVCFLGIGILTSHLIESQCNANNASVGKQKHSQVFWGGLGMLSSMCQGVRKVNKVSQIFH